MVTRIKYLLLLLILPVVIIVCGQRGWEQNSNRGFHPVIPRTWDDVAMADLEIPLADPVGSPKHVSAEYYYRMPVRPIYKEYPIYAPGHEPPGYMDWLKRQEPVILWGDKGHRPPLKTREDWIKAGEMVFDASPQAGGVLTVEQVQDPGWWKTVAPPTGKDGTLPGYAYLIAEKERSSLAISPARRAIRARCPMEQPSKAHRETSRLIATLWRACGTAWPTNPRTLASSRARLRFLSMQRRG